MKSIDIIKTLTVRDICVHNEYMDKYLELVKNPTPIKDKQLYEKHHVIPVSYYPLVEQVCDNTENNFVCLNIMEHTLAHYYLSLCAKNYKFRYSNRACVSLICHRDYDNITEQWIKDNLIELEAIREEQRRLNSVLQKGRQSGENNPRCKVTKADSSRVKALLKQGLTTDAVAQQADVPEHFVKLIRSGNHWTCRDDGFKLPANYVKLIANEQWCQEGHTCKKCGAVMTEKYKDGVFCSKHCAVSYSALRRSPETYVKIVQNRGSYIGERNPNYGKKASQELRAKLSESQKRAAATNKSTRFAGHSHSLESKCKISESLRAAHKKNPTWRKEQLLGKTDTK